VQRFRASKIFSDTRFTLISIESTDMQHNKIAPNSRFLYGKIEPVAMIILSRDNRSALNMNAEPITLDQLRQAIPELESLISPFSQT